MADWRVKPKNTVIKGPIDPGDTRTNARPVTTGRTGWTAVCGPACTVVWEGEGREAPPYPDPGLRTEGSSPGWQW